MNYVLGKPLDNKDFTDFEVEALSKIDIFDRKLLKVCKVIWDNKDNPEKLEEFAKQLNFELKMRKER